MRKADNLPPPYAVVTKSGNRNFLETSGPLQACNGTALPLPLPLSAYPFSPFPHCITLTCVSITATHRHLFSSGPKWRPGWRSGCSDSKRAGSFGVRAPRWGTNFCIRPDGPEAHPAFCTTGNGLFPGGGKAARSWR